MDYHLKPVGKNCAATGNELVPGRPCFSALVEEEGKLVRLDFSEEGWNGPPPNAVGYWRCIVPQPDESKAKPLDSDALMSYFEQLSEEANPAREKFRYVLALLLLQKRRLKLDGSRQEDDVEFLQLVGSRSEGPFEVRDFHLTEQEIQNLQSNLNSHLGTG